MTREELMAMRALNRIVVFVPPWTEGLAKDAALTCIIPVKHLRAALRAWEALARKSKKIKARFPRLKKGARK